MASICLRQRIQGGILMENRREDLFGTVHDRPPMYDSSYEHDNCGIGAIVNIEGRKSHKTVDNALTIVERLEHRAGKDASGETGDGVGILLQIPHSFFAEKESQMGLPADGSFGVGMFFFPQDELQLKQSMKLFEVVLKKEGLKLLGWRRVPIKADVLGQKAYDSMPSIYQCFIKRPRNVRQGIEFDRKLYIVRRIFEKADHRTYVCSLSSRTIVYKGMFLVGQLRAFYLDLQDENFKSAIAIVHSRFSTNTFPSWERAHPNRLIVHNGEINTIRGNVNKMYSREETMQGGMLGEEDLYKVLPAVDHWASDSAMLDNTLEFLMMEGIDLPKALMVCIPEPWANNRNMDQKKRDFYQYEATLMEPWDGPASILFSDGDVMGAVLDRNGLRPSRYYVTKDGYLILSSEVGVLDIDPDEIVMKDRLRPGKMLLVDTKQGRIISDDEIKMKYATEHPYGEWLEENLTKLSDIKIPNKADIQYTREELMRFQTVFGYTYEDINWYLKNTAVNGEEPIVAMGADTPLPFLSRKNPPLFSYFKQLFAQVTNPPIDAIREEIVTSTHVYLGASGNMLNVTPENCKSIRIRNPILTNTDLLKIKYTKIEGYKVKVIPITYYKGTSLEDAIDDIFLLVDRAVRDGTNIIILSDRDVDEYHVPVPSLLAVSAVQQHLVRTKNRTQLSIILESGEPREIHHFATLLGYGATAINPYLALDTIKDMVDSNILDKDYYAASEDYCNGVLAGVLRIASKMGISTIQSYMGAQIFEAVGIDKEVIDKYFTNTLSPVGGMTLADIEKDTLERHNRAFDPLGLMTDLTPKSMGFRKNVNGGEKHLYNPATIDAFQSAVRTGSYSKFKEYAAMIEDSDSPSHIRDLMKFRFPEKGVPLSEVESVESIVKRFKVGAMSYGALSLEAHETLAIAMNEIGGKSNTGEGGEHAERFKPRNGVNKNSAIKQVASARFGVTSEYLVSAKEIQIKMAQGAKPGEGGHLPGRKVYPEIAATRFSTPGVGLISPPPHHDIYSIEDLAQLIYDLKSANRKAAINVKLVSEAGVGTVAAGVAKAGAEVILISGYDGGTGAAPANSTTGAGLPWELGLAEAHQTLIVNGLRTRVKLETDGKLMTGRDVAIAALLGAEEFSFATLPMVAMGCVMMRVCNRDSCPMGIATQNPVLRKRFRGKPEYVKNCMFFIAQELREYMAKLGFRTVDEMVGRTDMLEPDEDMLKEKAGSVDLHPLLDNPYTGSDVKRTFVPSDSFDFKIDKTKDETVLFKTLGAKLRKGEPSTININVSNTDRAFGTVFGSRITELYGNTLEDDTYFIRCKGTGGQSFGAFLPKGMTLELCGDSNDYLGKGMSGGKIIVYPPSGINFKPEENIIIGNVALYGATSGKLFVNGVAGERFCVRNSGATAVVEGVGNHGIEYMTGGRVVILGPVGENLAAGMSGGIAYVLDEEGDVYMKLNRSMVSYEKVVRNTDVAELRGMIEEHVKYTGSPKGKKILENFEEYLPKFRKIMPHDYKRMLGLVTKYEQKGMSYDQAVESAFKEYEGGAE